MSFRSEFREFALKGNVMDMAIGLVIGLAFGKIVNSMVNDIVMPIIGLVLPSGDWKTAGILLDDKGTADVADDARIAIGNFIAVTLEFIVIAFVLFMVVKGLNRMRRKHEKKEAAADKPA